MNDTFLNTLLEISEGEKAMERRRPPSAQRPSSVLFSRPPSSILVSRPPSAAFMSRPHSSTRKVKRPPSTSTLKRQKVPGDGAFHFRPPSVSTIARPSSSMTLRRGNSIKCNVCTDGFQFTGTVPCFDSYCAPCLEDHILTFKRGTACNCQLCKSGILLPKTPKSRPKSANVVSKSDLAVCNNCDQSRLAQYRCNSCEEYFCEKCNKDFLKRMRIDSNFNATQLTDLSVDYNAISAMGLDNASLDSISLPSIEPRGFGIRCNDHESEEAKFHCVPCDRPVCRDCKILTHEGHETRPIEDVYEERKLHLTQSVKLANANVRILHAECAEINSKRMEIDQESRDAISLIENHANTVKNMIDDLSKSMIKIIRVQNTESRGTLQDSRDTVKGKVAHLQKLTEEATSMLDAQNNELDVINTSPELVDKINGADISPTAERLWRKKYVFSGVDPTDHTVGEMFGRLHTVMEGLLKEVPTVELEIQTTFNSDQKHKQTTAVAPLSDDTVWVCNDYKNKIQKFDSEGTLLGSETLDFDIDDMTDGGDDQLYLTELNGKVVRKMTRHKLSVFARLDTYLRGITLSRDQKNVIVVGNDVPVACLREAAICKIYVLTLHGRTLKEIHVAARGISLFRVCHSISNEYVISTGISALYYIIGENGDIKYRYKTSTSADGVACDRHGIIYLSACRDDTLYLLNCKGIPLPSTYAMHRPTSVSVDRNDTVWVGDWSKVHVLKHKV